MCNPVFTVKWKKISYDNKIKNGTECEKSSFPDGMNREEWIDYGWNGLPLPNKGRIKVLVEREEVNSRTTSK